MTLHTICAMTANLKAVPEFSYLMALGGMSCNHKNWKPDDMNRLKKFLMLRFHPDKLSPHACSTMFQMARDMLALIQSAPFGKWSRDVLDRLGCCTQCADHKGYRTLRDQHQLEYQLAWDNLPSIKCRRDRRRRLRIRRSGGKRSFYAL